MKIKLFKNILKVSFDHLDFISKNVSLNESVIRSYISPVMFYERLNYNRPSLILWEHEHAKRKFYKKACKKVEFPI